MSFKEIEIKGSYDSSIDDIIDDFYTKVLSSSKRYDRIAGFFTSSSLAISSKGLIHIADNGGKVRFLVSPKLSKNDVDLINNASLSPEKFINECMVEELKAGVIDIVDNYRMLLAHLIAKGVIEIKVVLIKNNDKYLNYEEIDNTGMFHQKVGIVYDEYSNAISFSGSINESFTAWNDNVEEFKTFKSWDEGQRSYCESDIRKFEDIWEAKRNRIEVYSLPSAVKNEYIEIAKSSDYEQIKAKILFNRKQKNNKKILDSLFWYQKEAVTEWIKNNYKMMFSMATGTGKTRTALACIGEITEENLLVIIATPQSALSKQWKDEASKLCIKADKELVCDSTFNYKDKLKTLLFKMNQSIVHRVILYTTHDTASSDGFLEIIKILKLDNSKILFIGDEVHGLGSGVLRRALSNDYKYRIGLSATPNRWFDEEGSDLLKEYFGNKSYEFGIDKALSEVNPITGETFLTPYNYYPEFAYLTVSEDVKYENLTEEINKLRFSEDEDLEELRTKKMLLRSEIVKSATNKMDVLKDLLENIKSKGRIENTLIFTSPKQLCSVLKLLNDLDIVASPLTKDQGNKPLEKYYGKSERQMIIQSFKNKNIQVIVAIKCMDEGIDIPSADTAILMSSTTNPREYIQRIGRVIRRYKGKRIAKIYDIIVRSEDPDNDKTIMRNELNRAKYIIEFSKNSLDSINKIYE